MSCRLSSWLTPRRRLQPGHVDNIRQCAEPQPQAAPHPANEQQHDDHDQTQEGDVHASYPPDPGEHPVVVVAQPYISSVGGGEV